MKVAKFGKTAIGTAELREKAAALCKDYAQGSVFVFSSLENTKELLTEAVNNACIKKSFSGETEKIKNIYLEAAKDITDKEKKDAITKFILSTLENITKELNNVEKDNLPQLRENVLSAGQLLSANIMWGLIDGAVLIDAKEVIKIISIDGNAKIDIDASEKLILNSVNDNTKKYIAAGSIGSDKEGNPITLGRGGSDYTASVIASVCNAERLDIWTTVDGFMTADPGIVSKAKTIKHLTYSEAAELSHFGATILFTPTIKPVFEKNIEIQIRNINKQDDEGTLINNKDIADTSMIKGISSVPEIGLITIHGPGMVGVKGTSMRLFKTLAENNVNVIFITQASSEYSITFAVTPVDTKKAVAAINDEFNREILSKDIIISVMDTVSIIAMVGNRMKDTPGISAKLFTALGRNGINVIATAQGSSERNISVVISKKYLAKAIEAIHESFFLSQYKELNLFLVGTGNVGGALIEQLNNQKNILLEHSNLKINIAGIMNIDRMVVDHNGIDLSKYEQTLEKTGETTNAKKFVEQICALNLRNAVMVDCTASQHIAEHYLTVLSSYISIVTANKIACSSEYSNYKELKQTAFKKGVKFLFETNVGAGLPIINTINDLIKSGDKILAIEAVLSGTLNFIFNELSENIPMSKAIMMAKEQGYSEPDPRIDLSGTDVVRKILILARESGYALEKEDVKVTTFIPDECFKGSVDEFWSLVKNTDADFEVRRKELEKSGNRWKFVARLDNGNASVQLMEVDSSHPAYNLAGSNNIILITTERYKELPMVIKGYGAGAAVTAAGIFSDIIRVANV